MEIVLRLHFRFILQCMGMMKNQTIVLVGSVFLISHFTLADLAVAETDVIYK